VLWPSRRGKWNALRVVWRNGEAGVGLYSSGRVYGGRSSQRWCTGPGARHWLVGAARERLRAHYVFGIEAPRGNGRESEGGPPRRERLTKCHAEADVAGTLRVASC
jgi:hypothetical protein